MSAFASRTVLVTGAGSGMGRSHALLFANRGAHVIVHDIDAKAVEDCIATIRGGGGAATPLVADIRHIENFLAALAEAVSKAGDIDILVNNAGIGGRQLALTDIDPATWDDFMAVHVRGAFFATQAVIPAMKARRYGRIINISSQWGLAGSPLASHYAGAKAALIGYAKAWAKEFAPFGITVNSVAPGYIETQMTAQSRRTPEAFAERLKPIPLGRAGQPIDISYAVAWLASDEAAFVTGHVLNASGGEVI